MERRGPNYDGPAMHGNPNLWLAAPEAAQHFDPARLTDDERARMARLRRATRRQEFAVSRALRSHVRAVTPGPASESLSHSGGYAALVQAHAALLVGVDLESRRPRDVVATARTAFNESETRALQTAAGPERERLFYTLWTVKEALAKALQLPLMEALRCCEILVSGPAWQGRIPGSQQGYAVVYEPRPELTLAVACIAPAGTQSSSVAAPRIDTWTWPPQQPASWPLIAAIALAGAGAPSAAGRGSAGAARAAAPASGSETGGSSCGSAPARPPAAS